MVIMIVKMAPMKDLITACINGAMKNMGDLVVWERNSEPKLLWQISLKHFGMREKLS